MDNIDLKIMTLLQENARMSNTEIARQVGMVPSGVLERIRKLEENGHLEEYTVKLNPNSVNLGLLAFVFVRTNEPPGGISTAVKLSQLPEIMEIHHVVGEDCYLLKIRLKDNRSLAAFLRDQISTLSAVRSTRTVIAIETVKETPKIPLPLPPDGE